MSSTGGMDTAKLYDSAGDDVLTTTPTVATLVGEGFKIVTSGFDAVRAYAQASDDDTDVANLFGSSGSDELLADDTSVVFSGAGFYVRAVDFATANIVGGGGTDTADLLDTGASDRATTSPAS